MRASGPTPGKNPKKVGDRPALNWSRLPWRTNRPPVNGFLIMKGPAEVWFTIAIPGWTFQVPVKSDGRLIPVCQSTLVSKVLAYSTRRWPPGAVESGITSSWRALLMASFTWKLFDQFQGPIRSGVWKLIVEIGR